MTTQKKPMSGTYVAVFVFSIFMLFAMFLVGAVTKSKSSIGLLIWGYTIWLMYKRKNESLVSLFKTLLWIALVAGGVIAVILFNDPSIASLTGFSATDFLTVILIGVGIDCAMLAFFKRQVLTDGTTVVKTNDGAKTIGQPTLTTVSSSTPTRTESSSTQAPITEKINEETLWEQVAHEVDSSQRKVGLWAKCFAEASGDENRAKAEYLKQRVAQLVMAAHEDIAKQEALAALAAVENVSTKIASQHENSESGSKNFSHASAHPIIAERSKPDDRWGWTVFWILSFIFLMILVISPYL